MTYEELTNLDPSNIGSWPLPVRIVLILAICIGILVLAWYQDIVNQRDQHARLVKVELEHKETLEKKQQKAANLEALKNQLKEMREDFKDMLKQLPNKTEVARLIRDISQEGIKAGLEFNLFKPSSEKPSDYYAELPISITVVGTYHQFGEFISGIAAMPRIVTTHDINITAAKGKKGKKGDAGQKDSLQMNATAKTYRALDEEEGG